MSYDDDNEDVDDNILYNNDDDVNETDEFEKKVENLYWELKEFVEENKIGVVLENWKDINIKIGELLSNIGKYSLNAHNHFNDYEFDKNFENVYNKISKS